jgi:hypothetical protein
LLDASQGQSLEAICLRHDVSADFARRILTSAARMAGGAISARKLDGPLDLLFGAIWSQCSFRPDFGRVCQPKLQRLKRRLLASRTGTDVQDAATAWHASLKGEYLSLEAPQDTMPFLRLLASAGYGAGDLHVRVAPRWNDAQGGVARLVSAVTERFLSVFGTPPAIEMCKERRGRPRAYLFVSDGTATGSAALGMSGVNALMLTVNAWCATAHEGET